MAESRAVFSSFTDKVSSAFSMLFSTKTNPYGKLDYVNERYVASPEQIDKIKNEVDLFVYYKNELMRLDNATLGGELAIYGLLWYLGFAGMLVNTACCLALLITTNDLSPTRSQAVKNFETHLFELMRIFNWCARDGGPDLLNDNMFMSVLSAIAPYVIESEKLLPEKLVMALLSGRYDVNNATKYLDLLANPPHHLKFIIPTGRDNIRFFAADKTSEQAPNAALGLHGQTHISNALDIVSAAKNQLLRFAGVARGVSSMASHAMYARHFPADADNILTP